MWMVDGGQWKSSAAAALRLAFSLALLYSRCFYAVARN